jgi:hypothetical protein
LQLEIDRDPGGGGHGSRRLRQALDERLGPLLPVLVALLARQGRSIEELAGPAAAGALPGS